MAQHDSKNSVEASPADLLREIGKKTNRLVLLAGAQGRQRYMDVSPGGYITDADIDKVENEIKAVAKAGAAAYEIVQRLADPFYGNYILDSLDSWE